jgi:hypothetical protein
MTSMRGFWHFLPKNNNQLKAAAATVMEMATMTAMTMTMKTKATALLTEARHWRLQRAGGGKSAAKARRRRAAGSIYSKLELFVV